MEFAVNQVEQRLCLQTKSANNTLNYQATEQVLMHYLTMVQTQKPSVHILQQWPHLPK